jgi:hypothetical protein
VDEIMGEHGLFSILIDLQYVSSLVPYWCSSARPKLKLWPFLRLSCVMWMKSWANMACFQRKFIDLQIVSQVDPWLVQLSKTKAQVLMISAPFWHLLDEILGEYDLFSTNLY